MSIEVKIPAVGESISSGVVSVWHKKSGEHVKAGEPLFTLETDKVSTEIVAEKAGVLSTIAAEGQEVKIGEVVATIDESAAAPTAGPETVATPDICEGEAGSDREEAPKPGEKRSPNAERAIARRAAHRRGGAA
jgi:2-oxoglutarate dehydrogenase E2 component (dihydrolipoamide succinyltransferase)